jgi:hypothetical protein
VLRLAVDDCNEPFVERELAAIQVGILREEIATVSCALLPELRAELGRALSDRRREPWVEMREMR